jgi:hypothetical protein
MLILTSYIEEHELKPLKKYFDINDLRVGAKKVLDGLGQQIHLPTFDRHYQYYKVRIGNTVKGRMIVFMMTENKKIVPLLIRLKKDKKYGMNMSQSNPFVVTQIDKNLKSVITDIKDGKFKQYD